MKKSETYLKIACDTVTAFQKGHWTNFLDTAAWMYKYPYGDQVMIYAQRPKATACAQIGMWNKRLGRWIKRGAKGIALLDLSGKSARLRYVFDIADTTDKNSAQPVFLWQINSSSENEIMRVLSTSHGLKADSLPQLLRDIAVQQVAEICVKHNEVISNSISGSSARELASFHIAAAESAAYVILKRCQMQAENYLQLTALDVSTFDTTRSIKTLGHIVNAISGTILREIERIVKQFPVEDCVKSEKEQENTPTPQQCESIVPETQGTLLPENIAPLPADDPIQKKAPEMKLKKTRSRAKLNRPMALDFDAPQESPSPTPPVLSALPSINNHRISADNDKSGGAKAKCAQNIEAIRALMKIENENRNATTEEQAILAKYVGWGGLPQAFDPDNSKWQNEYGELKSILTQSEYASARASTLTAFYTPPYIAQTMYKILKNVGFTQGKILEPSCGTGNFFGLLPDSMRSSTCYGVEIDKITGRIAKQLYPTANIQVKGFETTNFDDKFFDIAIGNVPFGSFGLADARYDKFKFNIHEYFIAKTLDKLRGGGIAVFIISKFLFDKNDSSTRRYIAERANLLGAIRIPSTAFINYAGTEVTMDMICLQKKETIDESAAPAWLSLGKTVDGIPVNSYFADQPEMILGQMEYCARMYGRQKDTACAPWPNRNLAELLDEAIDNIQGTYQNFIKDEQITHAKQPQIELLPPQDAIPQNTKKKPSHKKTLESRLLPLAQLSQGEPVDSMIDIEEPDTDEIKNYSFAVIGGEIHYKTTGTPEKQSLLQTEKMRIAALIRLRNCVHALIKCQLDDASDAEIRAKQTNLNYLYDSFTLKFGLISSRTNKQAFREDTSYYLLCSLEILDDEGKLKCKADMFTERTIGQTSVVTSVDTANEALAVSIGVHARVDIGYMSSLLQKPGEIESIIEELKGVIFKDPLSSNSLCDGWRTADEYLSGDVKKKLQIAQKAAKDNPLFESNVAALLDAQPEELKAHEIDVQLGSAWIDKKYIQEFMFNLLQTPEYNHTNITVRYEPRTTEWFIEGKCLVSDNDILAYTTYGTNRISAYKIIEDSLNLRDVRIYDIRTDENGKEKRVLNRKDTMLAAQKQSAIKRKFREWIFDDAERRHTLVAYYNEHFNSLRPRTYDGKNIIYHGMNPSIKLRTHQANANARILYGGNTILAHVVGAGKTFVMIAAAMEGKYLGLCNKNLMVVPNHLTEQWATEFLRLYPAANILVTTKKDFQKDRRKQFCSRIATGNYDAIIIGHTQFEKIPVSIERQIRMVQEQIDEIVVALQILKYENGDSFSIKQMERLRASLKARLERLLKSDRKDDVIEFESLGIDRMFVDEAHSYKNLFLYTKMRNVAGLSTSDAQKSSDMFLKCRYLDEITQGNGIIFATGTPVSNSMTELYTMQRYTQYALLKQKGWLHFDCWAAQFGETVTQIELAPEGSGYRARTRFARFFNLPELMNAFRLVADIQTADMLNLPIPAACYETIVANPTEQQKDILKVIAERARKVNNGEVEPYIDNMLKITTDGRKLGLDQRLINPMLPDAPDNKLNLCVKNVFRIWQETAKERLAQLIFCDFSTPNEEKFNVYHDMREKLLQLGVAKEEIAFIHDFNTEEQKKMLFAKVRAGKVRILLGSTPKMGAGTNVQDRLIALHDLDCPWRPGDLEQRSGRIVRQGNLNSKVYLYRYVTQGTFDSYLYQTIEHKQRFISQIMTSKSPVRSCEDVDQTTMSYAEIKALCAGDPRIQEKMQLDNDIAKLKMLKADFQNQRYQLEHKLLEQYPKEIRNYENRIHLLRNDLNTVQAHTLPLNKFLMTLQGIQYTSPLDAGDALIEICKNFNELHQASGTFRGLQLRFSFDADMKDFYIILNGKGSYNVRLGKKVIDNINRIEKQLDSLPNELQFCENNLKHLYQQVENARTELKKPFPIENELSEKDARLIELNSILELDANHEANESDQPAA